MRAIYQSFLHAQENGRKLMAVLIDPDKSSVSDTLVFIKQLMEYPPDVFLVGGSLIKNNHFDSVVKVLKESAIAPVILFPGHASQVSAYADAIFFMSLISGRNSDFLIGQQVVAAPIIKASNLESISLGYMLIDGGVPTSVSYMSNTTPIPADKTDIAVCTAMAGEMLGLKMLYLEAGSGAKNPIPLQMIKEVKEAVDIPLIVGGGIKSVEQMIEAYHYGADMVVVGTAIEKDPEFAIKLKKSLQQVSVD